MNATLAEQFVTANWEENNMNGVWICDWNSREVLHPVYVARAKGLLFVPAEDPEPENEERDTALIFFADGSWLLWQLENYAADDLQVGMAGDYIPVNVTSILNAARW